MTFESLKGKRMRQQWRARRAEAPGQSRVYVAAEVGWCCGVPDPERQHRRLVDHPLLDRQPVQSAKQRFGVRLSRRLKHNPSGVVLHALQLVDRRGRSAVQQSVVVVDSRQDQTACQRLRQIWRQQMSDVSVLILEERRR